MKKNLSKILTLSTLALTLLASSVGCATTQPSTTPSGDSSKSTAKLTVWGGAEDQKMLTEMVESFKSQNTDKTYDITIRVVEEGGAREEVLKDIDAAADVFSIPHDQVGALVAAGALYENTKYADDVKNNNIEGAVNAASYGGKVYGYPTTSETYYLTYDKRIFTEEDVKSLDTMLEKATESNVTKFANDFGSAYKSTAFFFANGCELFGKNGQDAETVTFNSPEGLAVANYIAKLKDRNTLSINGDTAATMFKEGTLGAYYDGPWKAATFKEALGDNYGVATLPAINFGDEDKKMVSFAGFKMFAVKSSTKFPEEAMALAAFLSNEDNQFKRFKDRNLLPTNKVVSQKSEITNDETLKTVVEQLQHSIPMPASPQMSKYWTPMAAFIKDDYAGLISADEMQTKLDNLVQDIKAK